VTRFFLDGEIVVNVLTLHGSFELAVRDPEVAFDWTTCACPAKVCREQPREDRRFGERETFVVEA
jgi:hypothetical protein